jgi:hypothetical protein
MKTLLNKQNNSHSNFKIATEYHIALQLYYIAKAEASSSKTPTLSKTDKKKLITSATPASMQGKNKVRRQLSAYLYSWVNTFYKRIVA